MNKVAVILSCYNGNAYIRKQIDSILNQEGIEVELFARDDGSKDDTFNILEDYDKRYTNFHFINKDDVKNVGVKDSFLSCLAYARKKQSFDYYSFSDQDDYWFPQKLGKACTLLSSFNDKYKLYYSNKTFTNSELKEKREEHIKFYNDFVETLSSSLASGCTMVFNEALVDLALSFYPVESSLHDSYFYRLAKCIGAKIVFDNYSYILYRQHGNNVCGEDSCKPFESSVKKNIATLKNSNDKDSWRIKAIRELDERFGDMFTKEANKYTRRLLGYKRNPFKKLRLMFDGKALRRGPKFYFNWSLKLLFNKF